MTQSVGNLLNCPTFRIEDRKAILNRVLVSLLASPDCSYTSKGTWIRLTEDEGANWGARQTIEKLLRYFR